ncbi:hypothetical protein GCM10009662_16660 [Catellatospora coxensis]|uniref:Saccharopine dehydrogenase-like protein n=1 Tax=Catellatospora coxensis TaxID=310354 RepID=A0A8J3L046_9ACTN|nr:hypothetical protein Cco03nite_09900 [Catellatospora coxensis]
MGRVIVIGDVGGFPDQLSTALIAAGARRKDLRLPADLTVIQVGDLVDRGPDSSGVLRIVAGRLDDQPDQWIQLLGNHESQYLPGGDHFFPERLSKDDARLLRTWWADGRLRVAAAVRTADGDDYLLSHAGLTVACWQELGEPATAAAAARLLDERPEPMLWRGFYTGADGKSGPLWAEAGSELYGEWLSFHATGGFVPFGQIHGHSQVVGFRDRSWRCGGKIRQRATVDWEARHVRVRAGGRVLIGVDPKHGRSGAESWRPLELDDTTVLSFGQRSGDDVRSGDEVRPGDEARTGAAATAGGVLRSGDAPAGAAAGTAGEATRRADRPYDVVLFGATGYTGGLTAEYLAHHAPEGCRWALAGRDQARLAAVRDRLAAAVPGCAELPLLHADSGDPASLAALAASARVVISTVGPYVLHGEPLVAACASAGTDYVDLTGEPEFIDDIYVRHHAAAVASGARLVHACGFDSVPHDLGVYLTVGRLPADGPIRVDGHVRAGGTVSGGTLASALLAFSRRRETARAGRERRALDPRPAGRRIRTPLGGLRRVHPDSGLQGWSVPLPTVDPQIVGRSAAALERYGPDFAYTHSAAVRRLPVALAGLAGAAVLFVLAQLGPVRRWLMRRRPGGQGPSAEQRAKSWFTARFVGEGGGRRVVTEVSGGDPGYGETAKMLAESALCLAFDELPPTSGQVTTAVAMGDALAARLVNAGLRIEVEQA